MAFSPVYKMWGSGLHSLYINLAFILYNSKHSIYPYLWLESAACLRKFRDIADRAALLNEKLGYTGRVLTKAKVECGEPLIILHVDWCPTLDQDLCVAVVVSCTSVKGGRAFFAGEAVALWQPCLRLAPL